MGFLYVAGSAQGSLWPTVTRKMRDILNRTSIWGYGTRLMWTYKYGYFALPRQNAYPVPQIPSMLCSQWEKKCKYRK